MEETTSTTPRSNTMMIALIAVIVLLAAVIVYIVLNNGAAGTATEPVATGTEAPATDAAAPPAGMPGATAEPEFDPATATKVAADVTPEQHVTTYFDAVLAEDFEKAYALLPTSKQASYGNVQAFTDQLKGYGMTEYTIDAATEEGGEAQVTATAVMPGGSFQYLWTFTKDGEGWLVKARTLPGMGS